MAENVDATRELQMAFAAHLRDPEGTPPPADIEDRRLQIYRDLFLGNVSSLLASSFPVLRQHYTEAGWKGLARRFLIQHRSQTPLFLEVPQEFIAFLEQGGADADDPPYVIELAHYEWVELALSVAEEDIDWSVVDQDSSPLDGAIALSPLAWALSYHYPVHRISAKFRPETQPAAPTHLIVYRNAEDQVGFIEANPVTARLLDRIKQSPNDTGRDHCLAIAAELNHPNPDTVVSGGADTLQQLKSMGIVLGVYKKEAS